MKLEEYIESLTELVNKHPEYLEYYVVTASDDEGNSYNAVHYIPSLMFVDEDGEAVSEDDLEYHE